MSQQNIDVAKRGYEAFSGGDIETVMSLFDDNLEWVQPGESTITGIYRGKGASRDERAFSVENHVLIAVNDESRPT